MSKYALGVRIQLVAILSRQQASILLISLTLVKVSYVAIPSNIMVLVTYMEQLFHSTLLFVRERMFEIGSSSYSFCGVDHVFEGCTSAKDKWQVVLYRLPEYQYQYYVQFNTCIFGANGVASRGAFKFEI